jgi:uncharacterized membrane protein YeaQ/YmgE (transglycosylase-associated protein family)
MLLHLLWSVIVGLIAWGIASAITKDEAKSRIIGLVVGVLVFVGLLF